VPIVVFHAVLAGDERYFIGKAGVVKAPAGFDKLPKLLLPVRIAWGAYRVRPAEIVKGAQAGQVASCRKVIAHSLIHGVGGHLVAVKVGVAGYELKNDMDILTVAPTVNAIANALSRLKEDGALRETLGLSARKKAEGLLVSTEAYLARYRQTLMACITEQTYTGRT
jgi:glycosyltransferase involved in cell wall biosynthesis